MHRQRLTYAWHDLLKCFLWQFRPNISTLILVIIFIIILGIISSSSPQLSNNLPDNPLKTSEFPSRRMFQLWVGMKFTFYLVSLYSTSRPVSMRVNKSNSSIESPGIILSYLNSCIILSYLYCDVTLYYLYSGIILYYLYSCIILHYLHSGIILDYLHSGIILYYLYSTT